MILYLKCRSHSIGLGLPTTSAEAANRLSALREGLPQDEPFQICDVSGPIANLCPYIQHADLEREADIQKLNALDARIRDMTQEVQHLFSGVLELERTGSLNDAIYTAGCLEQYMVFPKIKTDEELGRLLVDTSPITGKFSFPKEAKPYLDYGKIGAEQRKVLGGVFTPHGLVKRRGEEEQRNE